MVWRSISQIIIFIYLLEEETSLLILLPTAFSVLIEVFKINVIKRIFDFEIKRYYDIYYSQKKP